MDQVEKAFNGRYREVNRETQQWYTYNHPAPEPRPGMVSTCTLPSAGKSCTAQTDITIHITTLAITLVENLSYAPHDSRLKGVLLIYCQTVAFIICLFCQSKIRKKWIKSCHTEQYLSFLSVIKTFTSPVYHKWSQETRYILLPPHAWQGAKFCQRPLPDGQRDPQPAPPVEAKCSLHTDCCPSSPDSK